MSLVSETVEPRELARLCAADGVLFSRTFFPNAFRQSSPPMHRQVWTMLEDPDHRYAGLKMFRGSAKTTILRAFTAKRIAYGISRTIMFLSASQAHAIRSLSWIQAQITRNPLFAGTFGLRPGKKWTEDWFEIVHEPLDISINLVAAGITGQVRGVNIDDYRPDLIVCDDIDTEETTSTPEQRKKTAELFFGAIAHSLTPGTENRDASMVLLQTPFTNGDVISTCERDPAWAFRSFSCFDEFGESSWPERFPTSFLRQEKSSNVARGQLLTWMRDMEVNIISDELKDFRPDDLQYWHSLSDQAQLPTFMWIDPVPASAPNENVSKKDWEAIAVVGLFKGSYFLLESVSKQGHTPDWTIAEFFRLCAKWRPVRIGVEGTAYQRTLKWILDTEMRNRRTYYAVEAFDDKRRKRHRIVQALAGPATGRKLFVHPSHTKVIEQFTSYPDVEHEDELEAFAGAVSLASQYAEAEVGDLVDEHQLASSDRHVLENWAGAAP